MKLFSKILCALKWETHTERFDSIFSHIVKSNNLNFYNKGTQICDRYSAKGCRIMYQCQILQLGTFFIITIVDMANFRSKCIFYSTNIKDGQNILTLKKYSFDFKLHFSWNKILFAKFLWFLRVFFQIQVPGWKWQINFLTFWHLCLPWVLLDIKWEI